MRALFYFSGYDARANNYWRFAISVPDGYHDRHAVAKDMLVEAYPRLSSWSGQFICLTHDEIFKEL